MALHDLTALEQAAAIRERSVSSVELAEHYMRRAEELNDRVGAYALLDGDRALEAAAAADRAVVDGAVPLSVLHGVAVPIKDLNLTAGTRTRFGTLVMDLVPEVDDDVVSLIRSAGTVMLGKTTTPEFGFPCYTESDIGPYARTPWDLSRGAGGSSGGAAAAVASGLAPIAQGSDGGGSVRIPASCCGLVGVKPSRGRVSNGPLPDGPGNLVVQGVLARTVADAAALLGIMAGVDDALVRDLTREPHGLVIGRYATPVITDTTVDPPVLQAWDEASVLLESLGHHVIDIGVPLPVSDVPMFERVWAASAAAIPLTPEQVTGLRPLTRWLRDVGQALTPEEIQEAVDFMRHVSARVLAATEGIDVVLTPTLARLPAPIGGLRDDQDPARDFLHQKEFTPFTSPYNMTGQPAVTLPLHWTTDGLPVGVQLVGRPGDEGRLLALSAQMEQASPWIHRHPEVW